MAEIKGNRGEWSEIYVFLKLLATGKIYAADEHLNRIENMFFPIIKIIREEGARNIFLKNIHLASKDSSMSDVYSGMNLT
jgi:hypothetical protein